jgi:hypothetical protein
MPQVEIPYGPLGNRPIIINFFEGSTDYVILNQWLRNAGPRPIPAELECQCGAVWDGWELREKWGAQFERWPDCFMDWLIFGPERPIPMCIRCDGYYREFGPRWPEPIRVMERPRSCECEGCLYEEEDEPDPPVEF